MWKALLLLGFVASFDMVISCDDDSKCGPNERYVACPNTMCIPQNCSQRGLPVPCPILGPEGNCPGKPACICVENYLRDDSNGECIPSKKCKPPAATTTTTTESPHEPGCGCGGHPPKCGKNEVWNNCSDTNNCGPTRCSELGYPLKCDKKCKPGCVCKGDCVRDDNGVCIPIKNCPSCGGDPNAESGCGNNCGKTCATYKIKNPICTLSCKHNGCDCRDGYVYDPAVKACVRPKDCRPTCKDNEEYSHCINGGCGPKNCSQVGQPNVCKDPVTCIKGCVCVKGYLRAADGTCVPTDKCPPPECPKGEVWNKCPTVKCDGDWCAKTRDSPQTCPVGIVCDKPRCVCGYNRKRDWKTGKCIPIPDCPPFKCDCNEEYQACSENCPGDKCTTSKPICLKIGITANCSPKCRCTKGNCRNSKGKCVPEIPTCKVNEEYSSCINGGCGPKNCSQIGQPDICIDPVTCIKGCVCVKGYLRDANGTCVPTDKCPPPHCPKGEVWDKCPTVKCDGDWCPKTRDSPQTCPVGIVCDKPRCVCGYNRKRDWKTGKCIPIPDCPPFKCDCNEEYKACSPSCPGEKCNDVKRTCPKIGTIVNCRPQCRCTKGNCRNSKGKCVPNLPTCKVNEEYSSCINGGCGPKNCSQIGQPDICIDPVTCIKGCVCVKGYLRDANGTCVPTDKCPPPHCPKGEVWDKCPTVKCDGDWCPKTRDSPQTCPVGIVCDKPRCVCGYNRKRDWKTGKCIPIPDCPPFKCDCNEEYKACSPSCPGEKCNDVKRTCPKIGTIVNCRPQCRCTKGNCRNSKGKCVPNLPTCKVNEEYSSCINGGCGPKNCSQIGQPDICIDPVTCIKGCVCVKGYLRDANGTCVPTDKCPPPHCPKGEVWDKCPTVKCDGDWCPKTRDSPQTCPVGIVCDKPRCVCGYNRKRDWKTGKCIPIPDCPPFKCDCNEEYKACSPSCPGEKCNDVKRTCPKIGTIVNCRPQCRCTKGNCRNSKGKCVPNLPTCKVNEEYSSCINGGCGPKNCSQIGQPDICIDPVTCIKGCVCVKGYLRDANGTCVPTDKCPPPHCPKGEVWDKCPTVKCDGDWCPKTRDSPQTCPVGIVCDKPRCVCGYNRKRDWKTGKCIPIPDCPPFKCDCNEEYKACSPSCPGEKCNDVKRTCPKIGTIVNCRPQCRCTKGNCRNSKGKCVPNLPTCKVNEEYSSCINGGCGPKNCSQIGQPDICIDPVTCIKGCVCVKGYLRDANGTCVPTDKCPPPHCPKGEVWDKCPTVKCDGDWCPKTRDSPQTCPVGIVCDKPRCVCGYNRKRDWKTGKCIPIPDCPPFKCDCNEEYKACSPSCPGEKCNDVKRTCPKIGTIVNCRPQCRCTKGNCRNSKGKCVPNLPTCKVNEEYSSCINGGCGPKNCSQIGQPDICIDPVTCIKGCVCVKGYLRDANGTCVPTDKCPPPHCPKGEVWDKCPTVKCDGDWCPKTRDSPQTCPVGIVCDKPRCVCGYNRKRDWKTGKCIPIPDCPPFKCDCNEEYKACSPSCPGEKCNDVKRTCPKIGTIVNCRPQCRCTKGNCRNSKGKCVPNLPTCKVNEEYSSCINGGCGPKNCSQIGQPDICIDPVTCIKGCVCVKGYLRDANGTCVPTDKCPPPHCPKGEVWDKCPTVKCDGDWCAKTRDSPQTCPVGIVCDKPRCVCGYNRKRDWKTGKCIPIPDCPPFKCDCNEEYKACSPSCPGEKCNDVKRTCPKIGTIVNCRPQCRCTKGNCRNSKGKCVPNLPTCKVNEEYSSCINGGCGPKNCSQIGQPDICIDPVTCIKGCVCVKGYLRDANGTCVPTDKCPPPHCPKGEVWDKCPTVKCDGDWCAKTRDSPQTCPVGIVCDKPRCVCGYNRKRDWKTGKCIPIPDCPPFKCDCNEEYKACSPSCPGEKCNDVKRTCPKIGTIVNCRPQCRCTKGNCRNSKGKCVPNLPTCKVNEEYSSCINGGCGPKNCSQIGQPDICIDPVTCIKGCVCVKGYLRDANGTCVPTDKCPPPHCPKGEVWDKCPTVKCDGDWCAKTRDSPQTCPVGIVCDKPRCVCGYNRKRDWKTGKCIPIPDCPPFKCDCNEEYKACSPSCPGEKCNDVKRTCPKIGTIVNCRPQCRCTKGNCRNSKGKCVPNLPTCKVNEEYSSCINGGCGPKNCSQIGQPDICIDPVTCIKGCVCVKGYLRDANGTCVPTDKCPPPDCPKGEVWDKCPTVKCDGDWCAKTRDSPQTCPVGIVCDKPRCVCGYNRKRDWKTGKCIPIPDCPPFKCNCNEEYKACSPSCPGDKCTENNKRICPKIGIIVNCRPQCRCTKGHCRNNDGKCVLACKCGANSPVEKR